MIRKLSFIAPLLLTILSATPLLAQDSLTYRYYNYKKAGISFNLSDTLLRNEDGTIFNEGGTGMIVKKGKSVVFKGDFMQVMEKPKLVSIDSTTNAFLFATWSNGAHCCYTLYLATCNQAGFRMTDTLFLRDGDYKLRDIDADGDFAALATIDYFPYCWTSYAGSDVNLSIYAITKSGFVNMTAYHADLVWPMIQGYLNRAHEIEPLITQGEIDSSLTEDESQMEMNQRNLGALKQELACLLFAYSSIDSADEGWQVIKKEFPYKGRERFFKVLKSELEQRIKPYKPVPGE